MATREASAVYPHLAKAEAGATQSVSRTGAVGPPAKSWHDIFRPAWDVPASARALPVRTGDISRLVRRIQPTRSK
jgi:hypothetical protein